jgi:hypothetical protein
MPRKLPRTKQTWVQLTSEFVKEWPEVLEGIKYSNMPIGYVKCCDIQLKNNVTIHYDVGKELESKKSEMQISKTLIRFINSNYDNVKHVDLKFDIPKLKSDMESKTSSLLDKTFKN